MAKSVINGEIQHLSVTAIQSFNPKDFGGCNRRWYFKYVVGLPEEPQLAQITGTKIHKDIEKYLIKGTPISNEVVKAGLHFLPQPKTVEVEKPFMGILRAADIPMKGFIDVYNKSPVYIDSLGQVQLMGAGELEVIDWKSTSDLKYAKAGAELKTTQMVGYAKFASLLEPDLQRVRLSQVYFRTKGRAEVVKNSVIITLDEIQERYQAIDNVAKEIKQVALMERVEDVPANRAACTAYRGCPFVNSCPRDSIGAHMSGQSMIEKLREAKLKQQGQTTPAPTKSTPVQADPQEMDKIEEDYNQAGKVFGPCPQCAQTVSSANGSHTPSGKITHIGCKGVAVVPPDAPKPQSLPTQPPAPVEQPKPAEAPKPEPLKPGESWSHNPPFGSATNPVKVGPDGQPVKKTRGPNKPKLEVKVEPQTQAPTPALPGVGGEIEEGLTLFVDVRFSGSKKVEALSLEPLIVGAMTNLAEQAKVPDIRVAVEGPMAFGKWKAYLALEMVSLVHSGILKGSYTLNDVKESEVKQLVLEALTPHFDLVVRGA